MPAKLIHLAGLLTLGAALCTEPAHAQSPAAPAAPSPAPSGTAAAPSPAPSSTVAAPSPGNAAVGDARKPGTPASATAGSEASPSSETPTSAAQSGRAFIAHLPLSSAPLDHVRLRFDVRGNDLSGDIVVYFRSMDAGGPVRSVRAKRDEAGFFAHVPGEAVVGDGIAYWVVERSPTGEERAVFASSAEPQPVFVYADSTGAREARLLRMVDGRRSRVNGRFEYVNMGGFEVQNPGVSDAHDHYYRLEGQYAYRFFRGVEELEVAVGWLDGKLLDTDTLARSRVALAYGRTAVTFAFGEWFRLRPGVLLGVSTDQFEAGADLAGVVGDRDGTEFELGTSYVSNLGAEVHTRLGWCTIPRVPMGASVEVTNFPSHQDFGVRLLFDVGYRFVNGASLRLHAGYRGRTSLAGGPSLGIEAGHSF